MRARVGGTERAVAADQARIAGGQPCLLDPDGGQVVGDGGLVFVDFAVDDRAAMVGQRRGEPLRIDATLDRECFVQQRECRRVVLLAGGELSLLAERHPQRGMVARGQGTRGSDSARQQRTRVVVAGHLIVDARDDHQHLHLQGRRRDQVGACALGTTLEQRGGIRQRAARPLRHFVLEQLHQQIAHGIRTLRFVARTPGLVLRLGGGQACRMRLPQRRRQAGEHGDHQHGGHRHAAAVTTGEQAHAMQRRRRTRAHGFVAQLVFEIVGQVTGRYVTLRGIGRDGFREDRCQVALQRGRCRRGIAGAFAAEQLLHQHAQRVHVRGCGHGGAGVLLGRRIAGGKPDGRRTFVIARGVEQAGDAEVQQTGRAFGRDQDVGRLEVAVDHQLPMRRLHCAADFAQQPQARGDVQGAHVRMARDRQPIHVVHDEVGHAGVGDAAVDQARDRRVRERGQRLPFAPEQLLLQFRIRAAPQQFHRHALMEVDVFAFAEEHARHAALAEGRYQPERADALADPCLRRAGVFALHRIDHGRHRGVQQQRFGACVRGEQRLQVVAIGRVGAVPVHPVAPCLGGQVHDRIERLAQGRHGGYLREWVCHQALFGAGP